MKTNYGTKILAIAILLLLGNLRNYGQSTSAYYYPAPGANQPYFNNPNQDFVGWDAVTTIPLEIRTDNPFVPQPIHFYTNQWGRMQIYENPLDNNDPKKGFVGIGNYNDFDPQSLLHQHVTDEKSNNWHQFTIGNTGSVIGTGSLFTDGLRIGLSYQPSYLTGVNYFAKFIQQENAPMKFYTGTDRAGPLARMIINSDYHPVIHSANVTTSGYVGIGQSFMWDEETGTFPFAEGPRSLLHLQGPYNAYTYGGNGWRSWMKTGTYTNENSDEMYVGMKNENDVNGTNRSDAVIMWGDDQWNPGDKNADNFRLIFSANNSGNGNGLTNQRDAGTLNGLEVMRATPLGRLGMGPLFTWSIPPARRLELLDYQTLIGTSANEPQLRLTYTQAAASNVNGSGQWTDFQAQANGDLYIHPTKDVTGQNRNRQVGINTTDAQGTLDVANVNLDPAINIPHAQLRLSNGIGSMNASTYFFATLAGDLGVVPMNILAPGKVGILTLNPGNTLEIYSMGNVPYIADIATNGCSGLRLKNLTSAKTPVLNGVNGVDDQKVLTVDQNGDVVLVKPAGGTSSNVIGACNFAPALSVPSEINHDINDFWFRGTGDVGIGLSPCLSPAAKLEVNSNNLSSPTAGKFESKLVNTTNYNTAIHLVAEKSTIKNYGCLTEVTADGAQNYGHSVSVIQNSLISSTNYGVGVDVNSSVSSPSTTNYGVSAYAHGNTAHNLGGSFEAGPASGFSYAVNAVAIGSATGNAIGVFSNASGGIYNVGVSGYASTSSSGTNTGTMGYAAASTFQNIGVQGDAIGTSTSNNYAGKFDANSAGVNNYGAYGAASGASGHNYGVYGYSPVINGVNYAGYFNGDVWISGDGWVNGGVSITSDSIFKTNMNKIPNATKIISKLKPRTYNYKTKNPYGLSFDSKKQYGFIAEDVESILPEIVKTHHKDIEYDSTGKVISDSITFRGINYNSFFAILVQGMQEQQQKIDSLSHTDSLLNARLSSLENAMNKQGNQEHSSLNIDLSNANSIVLNQNVPNPFAEQTVITYSIPDNIGKAQIIFYDNTGTILKVVDIREKGKGQLNVFAADLSSGIYTYSLIADGKLIETKHMVCSK